VSTEKILIPHLLQGAGGMELTGHNGIQVVVKGEVGAFGWVSIKTFLKIRTY